MTALCVQACRQRRRTRFISAASLINELVEAQRNGQLSRALNRWKKWELLAIDLCGVVSNVELSAESPASGHSAGPSFTFQWNYRDSSQSRIVLSLLQGKRERCATGLTRAIAFRFISRSTFA